MSFVQSFSAVTPPPRYDAVPWTQVQVWESETEDGTYALIDTQAIAVDATPASPNTVSVTTNDAVFAVGWYRIRFVDGSGNLSNYTSPVLAPAGGDDGVYFTVAELRARFTEVTEAKYSDAKVAEAIALAEEAFEDAADVAFITRTATSVVSTDEAARVSLPHNRVTSVTSVTGATSGAQTLTDLRITGGSYLVGVAWPVNEDLTVVYEHGYDDLPLRVSQAVMLLARTWLINGPIDSRASQVSTGDGGVINLSTPGQFGAEFGLPEVDATLRLYRHHALVL